MTKAEQKEKIEDIVEVQFDFITETIEEEMDIDLEIDMKTQGRINQIKTMLVDLLTEHINENR